MSTKKKPATVKAAEKKAPVKSKKAAPKAATKPKAAKQPVAKKVPFDFRTITSFEAACKRTGRNPKKLPDVSMLPVEHRKAIIAFYMLTIIMEAVNNDPKFPNWNNSSQWKYYPWFRINASKKKPAGVGFSDSYADCVSSGSVVGSRLCCNTEEKTEFVVKQFEQLYIDMLLKA